MRAKQLRTALPVVTRETTALEAGRLIAQGRLGLAVADQHGVPIAVVSAVDVLRLMLPSYVLEDFSLAAVIDEGADAELLSHLEEHTIGELLDDESVAVRRLPVVDADAGLVEIMAVLADAGSQVALIGGTGRDPGFVTLPAVMQAVLDAGEGGQ